MGKLSINSAQISLAERTKRAYELMLPANAVADSSTISTSDELIFTDPRSKTPDRRTKTSLFFSTFKDRRTINRRHYCLIHGNWWILRKYTTDQIQAST